MKGLMLCLVVLAWAGAVGAETIVVRSGEHDAFSRLVLKPDIVTDWSLGRTSAGYELRFVRDDIALDLSRIFDFIPKNRLLSVTAGQASLTLEVAEGTHAIAFQTPAGAVVIDVTDGAPPEQSPFELPLDVAQADKAALEESGGDGATPDIVPEVETADGQTDVPMGGVAILPKAAMPDAAAPLASYRPDIPPDPRLAVYWKAPADVQAQGEGDAALPELEAPDATAQDLRPQVASVVPILPDPRVSEAEAQLLVQLGRAATQGLIEPARITPHVARSMGSDGHVQQPAAPEPGGVATATGTHGTSEGSGAAPPLPDPQDALNVHAETSIDRDTVFRTPRTSVNADGGACLSDEDIAIGSWGDARDFTIQMSEARLSLVGEFDIPDPKIAANLSRLYLYFGFGAEARITLQAFDIMPKDAELLFDIAMILDAGQTSPDSPLVTMADCDTAAAMWAVLARPQLDPGETVNHGAVLRTFSGLPLHLRRQFGPLLSDRFLGAGAPDTARAIRDAIARAPGEHGAAVTMIDAQLDLAEGNARSAEVLLDEVVAGNGATSPEALILAIQSRLDRGATVTPKMIETAGALAFEHRKAADGPDLSRVHILALGTGGAFGDAFSALDRWRDSGPARLQQETTVELFSLLSRPEAAPVFLQTYFANKALVDPIATPTELRMSLADRLLEEGFSEEARRIAGAQASQTETGRLFLARTALAEFDGASALRHIAGLQGRSAMRIRAQALGLLGRHAEAADAYLVAAAVDEAAAQAWQAGDWPRVADLGSAPQKEALAQFGFIPGEDAIPDDPAPPAAEVQAPGPGTLAQDAALLEDSRATRRVLDALLLSSTPIAPPNG